jgi:HSP20 family protein
MAMPARSPLRDFMSLRDAMDQLIEDRWISPGSWLTWTRAGATQYLPLDVYETPDDIVVRGLVPGVNRDGIDVQYEHGVLTIRTKTEAPEVDGATWLVREIGSGQTVRQISLPRAVDVDKATTSFENGVLTLTLPKTPDAKAKQIKVESAPEIGAGATAA